MAVTCFIRCPIDASRREAFEREVRACGRAHFESANAQPSSLRGERTRRDDLTHARNPLRPVAP